MSRRNFLQGLLATGAVASLGSAASMGWPIRSAGAAPNDSILILIQLSGGNDGLSTLIPADDGRYQDARGALAIDPASALAIGNGLYLNSNLAGVRSLYDSGKVALVQGVGDAADDRSHFSSIAKWMSGHAAGMAPGSTGWVGRWADAAAAGAYTTVSVGDRGIPLHMHGVLNEAVGLPTTGDVIGSDPSETEEIAIRAMHAIGSDAKLRGGLFDAVGSTLTSALDAGADVGSLWTGELPAEGLGRDLALAARTINLGLGTRVLSVRLGGFDTHQSHGPDQPALLAELDAAISTFYANLDATWADKVTLMTFSEFGRSWLANDSAGLDHGTSSTSLIIGNKVRGGLYGQMPDFDNIDHRDDLQHEVDYRSVYATVIEDWLGGDSTELLGASYETLDFFAPDLAGVPVMCEGVAATIVGTAGDDILHGTEGDDVIVGLTGNDKIYGGGGSDLICAGDGIDVVIAGEGDDIVYGGRDRDKIRGGDGNDVIYGEEGSDWLAGEGGNDILDGGSGADKIYGGDGADVITGGGGQDTVYGEAGPDTIQGNHQSDFLDGGDGNDTVRGAKGRDSILGGAGNDSLYGGDNTDDLDGGLGDDFTNGQRGRDNCVIPTGRSAFDTSANC